ncbi:MAG: hypothetical protein R3A51_19660 [Nannocystaceae bacterium]|nr:hypothetical protein [Myxococcales bacterium]
MRRTSVVLALACLTLSDAGCATHVPPNALAEKRYLEIAWQPDFVTARARAAALGKPMMVALVAGELDGLC